MTTDIESQIRRVADAAFAQTDPVSAPTTSISTRRRPGLVLAAASVLVLGLIGALVVLADDQDGQITEDLSEGFSASGVLAEVPLLGIDPTQGVMISGSDLGLLAETGNVEQPATDEPLAGDRGPYFDLAFSDPTVAIAESDLFFGSIREPEEFEAELGFGFNDVERYVTASQFGFGFYSTDGFELPFDAFVIRDGVDRFVERAGDDRILDIGDGPDGQPNVSDRTSIRSIGRPLRIAVDDDQSSIAVTQSTPFASAWLELDTPTFADVPDLFAAASALDRVDGLYSVRFEALDRDVDQFDPAIVADGGLDSFLIVESFTTIGIGWSGIGDEQTTTIVYVFADDAAATASAGPINDLYSEGELDGGEPSAISDLFLLDGVDVEGRAVVVTGTSAPEVRASDVRDNLFSIFQLTLHR